MEDSLTVKHVGKQTFEVYRFVPPTDGGSFKGQELLGTLERTMLDTEHRFVGKLAQSISLEELKQITGIGIGLSAAYDSFVPLLNKVDELIAIPRHRV
jgi:hypothetical protein